MYGIPSNFDELMTWYKSVLIEEGAERADLMGFRLIKNGALDDFRRYRPALPPEMSLSEAAGFVGVSDSTFRSASYRMAGRRSKGKPLVRGGLDLVPFFPAPVDGGSVFRGPYSAAEVEALHLVRHLVFPKKAKRGFLPSTVPGADFEAYLRYRIRDLLFAPPEPPPFQHPEGIPRNGAEMYRMYRKDVLAGVRRVIKYGIDIEDAEQEVWAKLLHADPITKYVQGAASKRIGKTMTGLEASEFLGLLWEPWEAIAPNPLTGDVSDEGATYATSDVLPLQKHNLATEPRKLPKSVADPWKFRSYVRSAATRHAINILRTDERRFIRDRPLANSEVTLVSQGGGTYRARRVEDRNDGWEATIESGDSSVDELADARRTASLLGLDKGEASVSRLKRIIQSLRRQGVEVDSQDDLGGYLRSAPALALLG